MGNKRNNINKELTCYSCGKTGVCEYKEEIKKDRISGIEIEYLEKYYECPNCGNKMDDDMYDFNVASANDALRKKTGLIRVCEIEEIIDKYDISQKNLSVVLGFGEIQISRYLKSGNPNKKHSDILKSIKDNPFIFEGYLLNAKEILDEKAYKKSMSKVKQLELTNDHSKLYNIGTYIIDSNDEISGMPLQKILYFINGFSKKLLGHYLFNDQAQAWIHGPVYVELYDAFAPFTNNPIDGKKLLKDKEFDLTEEEKDYIDKVSIYFSCYSGSKLRNMSHMTDPWINARKGLKDAEYSDRIISQEDITKYFNKIVKEYNIEEFEDIEKYAKDLFDKTFEK